MKYTKEEEKPDDVYSELDSVQTELTDTFNISDLETIDTLNIAISNTDKNSNVTVTSAPKSTAGKVSDEFQILLSLLYYVLPEALHYYWDVKYKKVKFNKKKLITLIDNVEEYLKANRFTNASIRKNIKGLKKIFIEDDNIEYYYWLIDDLHTKYYKTLVNMDKKVFLKLYQFMGKDDLDESLLDEVLRYKNQLLDSDTVKMVRSIKVSKPLKSKYKSRQAILDKTTSSLFGTETPSFEEVKLMQKKKPVMFKKWRKLLNSQKSLGKNILEDEWRRLNYGVVPVKIANNLLRKLKLPTSIDKGFSGKVDIGETDAVQFKYFTYTGLELSSTPGKNVIMNDNWDESDNEYYCRAIPASNSTDKLYGFYTIENEAKRSDRLFQKAKRSMEGLEDFRITYNKDLNKRKEVIRSTVALVVKIMDITSGRIGNRKSEKSDIPTYGIHNLKAKHLKISNNKAVLAYPGKGNHAQRHTIIEPVVVKLLKTLKTKRKANQYLFSKTGESPISSTTIGNYFKECKYPGTPHTFRKLTATKVFSKLITKKIKTNKGALSEFKKAVNEVSKALGNTPAVALSAYLSPLLVKTYFERFEGITLPAGVKKMYKMMKF